MRIEELERALIDLLRAELASIEENIGQTQDEWIYIDYPRPNAKMPRISLTLSSSPTSPFSIGAQVGNTFAVFEETSFDIDVWIHSSNKTTGLTPQRKGTSLREWLADKVVDVFLKKRSELASDYGILDIEKVGESVLPFDEETELFRKTLTFRVSHLREF